MKTILVLIILFSHFTLIEDKDNCPPENFKSLKQKPIISLLFDEYKVKNAYDTIDLNQFEKINFLIDFVTIQIPRECYYFENVEVSIVRNRMIIFFENYKNVEFIEIKPLKSLYQKGDRLIITPFPKLKTKFNMAFCPLTHFINLK